MRMNQFVTFILIAALFANQSWGAVPQGKISSGRPQGLDQQINALRERIARIEALLAQVPEIREDPDVAAAFTGEWVVLTCHQKRLEVQQIASGIATKAILDKIEKNCQEREKAEAATKFSGTPSPRAGQAAPAAQLEAPRPGLPPWCTDLQLTYLGPRTNWPPIVAAQPDTPPALPSGETQLRATSSSAEITTRNKVFIAFVNRLRYDADLGGLTTVTAMPSIPQEIFAQPTKPSTTQTSGPALTNAQVIDQRAVDSFDREWKGYKACLTNLQGTFTSFKGQLSADILALGQAKDAITARLQNSALKVVDTPNEARRYADDSNQTIFPGHRSLPWPATDIQALQDRVTKFRNSYDDLKGRPDYNEWIKISGNQDLYNGLTPVATDIGNALTQFAPATDAAKKADIGTTYNDNLAFISSWYDQFRRVATAADSFFIKHFDVTCRNWLGQGSKTQMQLTTHDLLHPDQAAETANLDIVLCNSPLTVTSGLGLSFIPDRVPAFVPTRKLDAQGKPVLDATGNPVIVQSLGFSSDARVHPGYSLQVNTAIKEFDPLGFGFHWMLGTSITAANQGTALDFITGPAFSFRRRTFFVSPAYDLGRRTDLLPQFSPGDIQGNLTSPPTQQRWHSGFSLTITFPFTGSAPTVNSSSQPAQNNPGNGGAPKTGGSDGGGKKGGGNGTQP